MGEGRALSVLVVHSWVQLSGIWREPSRRRRNQALAHARTSCAVHTDAPTVDTARRKLQAGLVPYGLGRARAGASAVASDTFDAVHFHNVYPAFSPAALRLSAPVFMTLHSYRLMCIGGAMVRGGAPCELCLGHAPWFGVVHRCFRQSRGASCYGDLACRASTNGDIPGRSAIPRHEWFSASKIIEAGFPDSQVAVKPNFAWPTQRRDGPGDAFVLRGSHRDEGHRCPAPRLARRPRPARMVAGDGPLLGWARANAGANVEFTGVLEPAAVAEVIRSARAVVVPSQWYEGAPRTIIEAFAAGVGDRVSIGRYSRTRRRRRERPARGASRRSRLATRG